MARSQTNGPRSHACELLAMPASFSTELALDLPASATFNVADIPTCMLFAHTFRDKLDLTGLKLEHNTLPKALHEHVASKKASGDHHAFRHDTDGSCCTLNLGSRLIS